MSKRATIIAALGAILALAACVTTTPYQSEGDRLQSVGEQTVKGIDTSGLKNLR